MSDTPDQPQLDDQFKFVPPPPQPRSPRPAGPPGDPRVHAFALKLGVLFALLVFSTIPHMMVSSVISDRKFYQKEAIDSVVNGWAARHQFGIIDFYAPTRTREIGKDKLPHYYDHQALHLEPSNLKIKIKDTVEIRKRRIFEIPIYKADLNMSGDFIVPKVSPSQPDISMAPNEQTLVFFTKQANAIADFSLMMNGVKYPLKRTPEGLRLELKDKTFAAGETVHFELQAKLNGYDGLDIAVKADELDLNIDSQWPHPSFIGQLPVDQTVGGNGFTAHWKMIQPIPDQVITVNYISPVDLYSQTDRAVKYAMLIVLLVLCVLFLMEVISKISIHPMQYLLLTLPLSVYYILLLAFAEHIGFNAAYATASAAVIGLIYFYFSGLGHPRRYSLTLSGLLALVYGLILTMLASEDYALLIGAICLFVALASFMLMTRKINWSKGVPVGQPQHG